MEEYNFNIKLKAKNQVEAGQVKKAFETMVSTFQAEGIIKMEKIFKWLKATKLEILYLSIK